MSRVSRRAFLNGAGALGLSCLAPLPARAGEKAASARPFPLSQVRLSPSPWLDAVHANRRFLISLDPDRLLARFRENAGLEPKGEVYGGWESDTIAGHTLGHYLSALSLMHAQTGDAECRRRGDYIVSELAACQAQSADGYVAALGRRLGGTVLSNGKSLFDDVMKGEIDPRFGNLNGGWAPLYNIHKQLAGLLEAHKHLGNAQALAVAAGMAGYLDHVFSKLDEAKTQLVLDCEYGGLQESIAELYARTGERRWLLLARRLRHERTFQPVAAQRDELDKVHSNTEIPKYVGSARLYEVGGGDDNAAASRFFWHTVTRHRSYVVGGNGDREWFYPKGQLSRYITDQTCEHCSTYNMLKITRHLFQWEPKATWFDFYERAHLNHTLAAQHPETGMFAYMMPTMAGAKRTWSQARDQFWCCMGSGMEAHASHGDAIYWQGGDASAPVLYINEFIPSTLDWPDVASFELKTAFPHSDKVELVVTGVASHLTVALKLRLPGWCAAPVVTCNGRRVPAAGADGYATVKRRLRKGDRISMALPMSLASEATPGDASVLAFLYGPMVLAADLGLDGEPLAPEDAPAVFADDNGRLKAGATPDVFNLATSGGDLLTLRPFYRQWDKRTAVYFASFKRRDWPAEAARRAQARSEREAAIASALDVFTPGDPVSESAHAYADARTELTPYRGRKGRLIKAGGGFIEADLACAGKSPTLFVTYWGGAERGMLDIRLDGVLVATQKLDQPKAGEFFEAGYVIPAALARDRAKLRLRLEPQPNTRGPSIYGVRVA
jgi:DUF1680 family protein